MKHLNKLASVFCVAAMGLTALTGCEGSDMFSVNSPDWLSEKIDSIEKSKGSTEEVLVGMNEDVYTVGNTDFSSGFWSSFSKYYVVQDNQKWNAVFNLNINPSATNTYKNFALIFTMKVSTRERSTVNITLPPNLSTPLSVSVPKVRLLCTQLLSIWSPHSELPLGWLSKRIAPYSV